MACLCKNPDGTWAQTCSGTCSQKSFVQPDAIQMRSEKSIEDRFEYLLGVFLQKLDDKIHTLSELCMAKYREGYRDGFNDGQSGF